MVKEILGFSFLTNLVVVEERTIASDLDGHIAVFASKHGSIFIVDVHHDQLPLNQKSPCRVSISMFT